MPGSFWLINGMHFCLGKFRITILGAKFNGEIEVVGADVKRFIQVRTYAIR